MDLSLERADRDQVCSFFLSYLELKLFDYSAKVEVYDKLILSFLGTVPRNFDLIFFLQKRLSRSVQKTNKSVSSIFYAQLTTF